MTKRYVLNGVLAFAIGALSQCLANNSENKKPEIYIVCTAAIIPQHYQLRKGQYEDSLRMIRRYGYEPYVVESCSTGPTFLDNFTSKICYTQSNNPLYTNKGINEAISLKIGLEYFNFPPESMIIKHTGRYVLHTDEFIQLVKQHPNADVIARIWNPMDAYSGLFAIKAKFFAEFVNDYLATSVGMGNNNFAYEWGLGRYIEKLKTAGKTVVHLPRIYGYLPLSLPPHFR